MTFLSPTVLTASYYDNYNFRSLSGFSNTALNYESSGLDAIYLTRYGDDTQASEYKHTGLLTGTAVLQLGGNSTMLYYVNYYDAKKRLIQAKSTNHIGGTEFDYFAYNFIGQPLKKRHVHSATGQATQTEVYTYNYDSAGRLLTTLHKLNTSNEVTISENTYDELGRLLTNKKGGLTATQLTYAYNVRSWTKSITGNLFSENLYYNESSGGNTPRYNGNITSISWVQDGNTRRYNYTYDDLSRLTAAGYTGIGSELYGTSYSYDKHGNILTLQRYGNTSSSTWGIINNLTMTYTGNQLTGLREGSGPVLPYTYDANGNMTSDGRKNLAITYNVLNLQQSLSQGGTAVANYSWLADGTKCGVVDNNNNGYDYTGSLIYSRSGSTRTLESIDNGVGRIYYSGGTYNPFYYLTDHLGSTRAITNSSGTVVERNDYYPFGGQHGNSSYPQLASNRFKYNGKELQTTGNTGFLDYGARMYDAVIGRWSVVDPAADRYPNISPYAYCANNPIIYIDPTGMYIEEGSQREWERRKEDVTSQRDILQKQVDKLTAKAKAKSWSAEKLASKIGDKNERIASLNNSLGTMGTLESSSQGYSLSHTASGENGGVTLNSDTKIVDIKFGNGNTGNFVHEMTHAGQFEAGKIAFDSKTGKTLAQDVYDEVSAYKSQFAFDPSSVSGLPSTSVANSFGSITSSWVQGLAGGTLYALGGTANTGVGPLNINSTRTDFINAYPNNPAIKTLPASFILKTSYPNIYYKK